MIYLIDNYDSFSYNLYQLLGSVYPDIAVVRNDAITVDELASAKPCALVLSPGPGRPAEAGMCEEAVRRFSGEIPILGVCLGHQAIVEAFGGVVDHAHQLMHGKTSHVFIEPDARLLASLGSDIVAGRYHSLAAMGETLPDELRVVAKSGDGEIMAIEHVEHPTFGLQFHPESIMTPSGRAIVENFVQYIEA